jgi:hypothetical protein
VDFVIPRTLDPVKQRAGRIGSRKRWGPRRIVRLDTLPPVIGHVIRELVAAAEAAEREKAAAVSEKNAAAAEQEGHADVRPAA